VATSALREQGSRRLARDRFGLTDRERDVLDLLCDGLSNAAIAERLRLTEKTVKNHLNHIFAKLGVRSRTEAVVPPAGHQPGQQPQHDGTGDEPVGQLRPAEQRGLRAGAGAGQVRDPAGEDRAGGLIRARQRGYARADRSPSGGVLMRVEGSVAFVTGGSRGFGLAMAEELAARDARKVYVGVRDPASFDLPAITAVDLDVTSPESVAAVARRCDDVTLLVNNAGTGAAHPAGTLDPDLVATTERLLDVNLYGVIRTSQALTPVIAGNGGGAIVNVVSDEAWYALPVIAGYAMTKAAEWNFTNALRIDLRPKGIEVLSLHVGFMDTDLTRDLDVPKADPGEVAATTLDGLEDGAEEVIADEQTRLVKQTLSTDDGYYLHPRGAG
jgi:NAD(P)-dependent dehydrogenase (short-subunit alcohol dehydrogenase family)/DNA-binding CsgD family transcriptional regulator